VVCFISFFSSFIHSFVEKTKKYPKKKKMSAAAAAAATTVTAPVVKKDEPKGSIKGLDDDKDSGKSIILTSKDKKEFKVERKHAFISTLVKTSMENDDKADEVPIPGVTGSILELVVQYMKEHKGVEPPIIEKPLRSKVMKDVTPHKWDAEYVDKIGETRQQLYDLILASNYMDIKSLLHLGCAKVASLIKGQPLEKIKEILDPNQGTVKKAAGDSKDVKTGGGGGGDSKDVKTGGGGGGGDDGDVKMTSAVGSSGSAATAAAVASVTTTTSTDGEPAKKKTAVASVKK
jgi:S-phase kinase-associated protein 1